MKKESGKNTRRENSLQSKEGLSDSALNLGLDADQSSIGNVLISQLNSDNDRMSHNPDGEDDQNDTDETAGHSPLEDK